MRIRTWAVIALGVIATGAWAVDVESPPPQAIEQVQEKPVETSPEGQNASPASAVETPSLPGAAAPAADTPSAPSLFPEATPQPAATPPAVTPPAPSAFPGAVAPSTVTPHAPPAFPGVAAPAAVKPAAPPAFPGAVAPSTVTPPAPPAFPGAAAPPAAVKPAAPPAVPGAVTPSTVTPPAPPAFPGAAAPPAAQLAPRPAPVSVGGGFLVKFNNADVYEVIQTLGRIAGINYLIDPRVRGVVNVNTQGAVKKEDALEILFSILRINGATAVLEGNVYHIVPMNEAKMEPLAVGGKVDLTSPNRPTMRAFPLQYIAAAEMVKVIKPFLSAGGDAVEVPRANMLLVVDTAGNMEKHARLVDLFDA